MTLTTPPSLDLSAVLPSAGAPTTTTGTAAARTTATPPAMLICPPGEASAEQALLVGSGISCVP